MQAQEHLRLRILWQGMQGFKRRAHSMQLARKGLGNLMQWRLSRAWASWIDAVQVRPSAPRSSPSLNILAFAWTFIEEKA